MPVDYGQILLSLVTYYMHTRKQHPILDKLKGMLLENKELGDPKNWSYLALYFLLKGIISISTDEKYEKKAGELLQYGTERLPKEWLLDFGIELPNIRRLSNFKEIVNAYTESFYKYEKELEPQILTSISTILTSIK